MGFMWKIEINENSFSSDNFKDSNLFAFGGNFEDLSLKTDDEIRIRITESNAELELNPSQFVNFIKEIKIDDHILFVESSKEEYLLGKVTSDYYFNSNLDFVDFYNFRDIKFLREIPIDHLNDTTIQSINQCDNIDKINVDASEDILNVFFLDTPYNPENFNLKEGLKVILTNYSHLRDLIINKNYETNENNNLKSFIYRKFPNQKLLSIIDDFGFEIEFISFGSHHQGNLPPLAFITIKYPKEGYRSGSKDFYYVVYLFRCDLKGVYLTLGFGSSHINRFDKIGFRNQIEEECEDKLNVNEFNPYKINLYSSLEEKDYNFSNEKSYEECTLFWKYYDFSDKIHFPDDDDLTKDLKDYLDLYIASLERCDFESFIVD